jgi:hypothetical protein
MPGLKKISFQRCQYIRGQSGSRFWLGSLQVASRHLTGLCVAFEFVADLLALDDFPHSGALDGGNVYERISAAIVRLDKAEALGGIEPFNCACGHDEPFQSKIE